jgi:hypothetical protein
LWERQLALNACNPNSVTALSPHAFFPRAGQELYKKARFDRVLLRGLRASHLQLIGTESVTPGQPAGRGEVDCLSDHFGLLCTIEL